jgi:hypothetical protein
MSCCGRQRAEFSGENSGGAGEGAAVRLSYGGVQTIMVRGAATGSLYRFAPGVSMSVPAADAASMAAIPGLRQGDARL